MSTPKVQFPAGLPADADMKKSALELLLSQSPETMLEHYVPLFSKWLSRHGCLNDALVKPEVYRLFQEGGFHLARNHYYGPMPDTRELTDAWWETAAYQTAYGRIPQANVDSHFERILHWSTDLKDVRSEHGEGFFWNNPMFPPLDALAYYGMVREYRPPQLIEIGSGYSTEIALLAARHTRSAVHCIEPYPGERLLAHEGLLKALTRARVQDVEFSVFEQLRSGDILFIDTSHITKIGSDVNHLLFNVLPRLAPGVIVHIHDIFLPYEYPRKWYDDLSIFFNEQYLVLACLMNNPDFELLLPIYALSVRHEARLRERLRDFDIWNISENMGGARGASFWIRKV